MAAKPAAPHEGYAVLEFNSRALIMSPADAAIVFPILCRAELAKKDWAGSASGYVFRRSTDDGDVPTLKPFTVAQYATMNLEDES